MYPRTSAEAREWLLTDPNISRTEYEEIVSDRKLKSVQCVYYFPRGHGTGDQISTADTTIILQMKIYLEQLGIVVQPMDQDYLACVQDAYRSIYGNLNKVHYRLSMDLHSYV